MYSGLLPPNGHISCSSPYIHAIATKVNPNCAINLAMGTPMGKAMTVYYLITLYQLGKTFRFEKCGQQSWPINTDVWEMWRLALTSRESSRKQDRIYEWVSWIFVLLRFFVFSPVSLVLRVFSPRLSSFFISFSCSLLFLLFFPYYFPPFLFHICISASYF